MLTKCVCPNCGHSYLADDDLGDMSCPRCEVLNEGLQNGTTGLGASPVGAPSLEPLDTEDRPVPEPAIGSASRFDPQTPPPMFITRDRLVRGIVFGALTTLGVGLVLGAALAAVNITIPGVAMIVLAFLGGAACRSGFGGRAAPQSKGRAIVTSVLVPVLGLSGLITGSWALERYTGTRADQTRLDLTRGMQNLRDRLETIEDAGMRVVLDQKLEEADRLSRLTGPQIEDYLWTLEAQINQPLLAYGKLRATRGPVVHLGAESDPITLPREATLAILAAELILGMIIVARSVMAR